MSLNVNVINQFSAKGGICLLVEPTPELVGEDLLGVDFDFELPDGRKLRTPVEKHWFFDGNIVLYFGGLANYLKPLGFNVVAEDELFDFSSGNSAS